MKKEFARLLKEKNRDKLPGVLLAAAECAPLSKTGGLADVVGTLPPHLNALGFDARVITPYHRVIKDKYNDRVQHLFHFYVDLGWRHEYAGIELLELDGVKIYLVDSERYFGDKIYRGGDAEIEQYAFFTRAVMDAMPELGYDIGVVHCNDWHTAMLPMLARTQYPADSVQAKAKYLLTIHNIAFQGKWDFDYIKDLLGVEDKYYTSEFMELGGCADFLKGGCVFAHRINTVSPSYAEEIMTPEFGEGLEGILSARCGEVSGIINGIDVKSFNPRTDMALAARYDRGHLSGKAKCKADLQERFGLEVQPDVPLIAMVTRMTEQKGFGLITDMLRPFLDNHDCQLMLLGTGDGVYEDFMRGVERDYKGRVCSYIGYSEPLSHQVYAASDFFLMPSRFEPCGLSQMIAMRYGSVPVVHETGGLRDTVEPYNKFTGTGCGFSFKSYTPSDLYDCMSVALACYGNKEIMSGLISDGMSRNFSFDTSAEEYARHYLWML